MRGRSAFRAVVLFTAALVASLPLCLGAEPRRTPVTDLQPLEEGTTWVYDYKAVMQYTIQSREHTQTMRGKVTTRVEGRETRQGREYSRVVSTYDGLPGFERQVVFQRIDEAGHHNAVEEGGVWTDRLLLALPATVGSSWSMDARGAERRTIAGVVDVEIPWRRFTSCLKVVGVVSGSSPESPSFTMEDYLCPGFGQVRSVVRGSKPDAKTDVEMTLTSFSVPGNSSH
jgi:hypothetical protein